MYWIQAFELIVNLMDLLDDQYYVTQQIIAEYNGLISVFPLSSILFFYLSTLIPFVMTMFITLHIYHYSIYSTTLSYFITPFHFITQITGPLHFPLSCHDS
ncbi:hypothetical protein BDF14DRAFT_1759844 [Spinellus fusiger]|nr:hypothetical protein BDF14DRAFT_1759844 [Spinellus fusiger]